MKAKYQIAIVLLTILTTSLSFAFSTVHQEIFAIEVKEHEATTIELLQNGESYSIEITSIGCFNGSRQTLAVFKEDDVFTVHFQDNSKVLSETEIGAFITFEQQLRSLTMGGCSTVDTYVLRYGSSNFQTSDGTCTWNGGRKLLQRLGFI